jgi:hypothetical protein
VISMVYILLGEAENEMSRYTKAKALTDMAIVQLYISSE